MWVCGEGEPVAAGSPTYAAEDPDTLGGCECTRMEVMLMKGQTTSRQTETAAAAAARALICHTSETDETHDGYDG